MMPAKNAPQGSLQFGLRAVPSDTSSGLMTRGAHAAPMEQAPWLLLWPCIALTGAVLALNLLCGPLRDVLDSRASRPAEAFLRRATATLLLALRRSRSSASSTPAGTCGDACRSWRCARWTSKYIGARRSASSANPDAATVRSSARAPVRLRLPHTCPYAIPACVEVVPPAEPLGEDARRVACIRALDIG